MISTKTYEDVTIEMEKSDILLLYTDGISEVMKVETKEFYGSEQMQKDIELHSGSSSKEIVNSIIEKALLHSDFDRIMDDMTMVCIKKV